MKATELGRLATVILAELFSPRSFAMCALLLVLFFGAVHIAGWREHTTFLSGTLAADGDAPTSARLGLTYLAAWFGFVLLAPVFVLAAGLLAGVRWLTRRRTA
jgi:hypothetical protein